jgi:hypothetical protein
MSRIMRQKADKENSPESYSPLVLSLGWKEFAE